MAAVSAGKIACFALLVSFLALQVPSCVDQRGTTAGTTAAAVMASASAPPPLLDGAVKVAMAMLALAGMDAVLIAAAVIYSRHTHHAAGAAGGNWRVSELAFFVLCLQVGVLHFVLFVQDPAAAAEAAARAIGTSAARALPCVASVTFFLGITLIYAHVGNAGGGAAGGAVAGNGPIPAAPATIRLLANTTLGAALACLICTTLALFYTNTM